LEGSLFDALGEKGEAIRQWGGKALKKGCEKGLFNNERKKGTDHRG